MINLCSIRVKDPFIRMVNSSLFTLHSSLFSVCKGTHYFFPFPKIAKKLHHFNIRLHDILTFRRASMCDIAMVGQYAPESI